MAKGYLEKLHYSEIKVLDEIVRICKKQHLRYFLIGGTLLGAVRHSGFIPWDDDLDIAMPREDYEKFLEIAPKELKKAFLLDDYSTNNDYWLSFAKVRLKDTALVENSTSMQYKNNGIWVDIFPLDYTNHFKDSYIKLKWQRIRFLKSVFIEKNSNVERGGNPKVKKVMFLYKFVSSKKIYEKLKRKMTSENKNKCEYFVNYGSKYGVMRQTHEINKILPLRETSFEGKKYLVPNDSHYVLRNIYGESYMKLPPVEKRVTHNPKYVRFEDGEEIFFNEKI